MNRTIVTTCDRRVCVVVYLDDDGRVCDALDDRLVPPELDLARHMCSPNAELDIDMVVRRYEDLPYTLGPRENWTPGVCDEERVILAVTLLDGPKVLTLDPALHDVVLDHWQTRLEGW
jgi:hypothetical protein